MNTSIKDFVDVGDASAPIGSPAWCQAAHVQLCATKRQTDWEVRRLKYDLLEFKNKERWKQLAGNKGRPFRSWKQYVQTPEPEGLGIALKSVDEVLKAIDDTLIGQVLSKHGGDRRSEKFKNQDSRESCKLGDNDDYWRARLARDRPDILERFDAGEFENIRDAVKVAGIKIRTYLDRLRNDWKNASLEEREIFRKEITRPLNVID